MNSVKHQLKVVPYLISFLVILVGIIILSGESSSLDIFVHAAQAVPDDLTYFSNSTQQSGPAKAGEIESADIHITYLDEDSLLQSIYYPEAAFMKVHFASLRLLERDYVTVSNAMGTEVYTYPKASDSGNADGEGFWAMSVMGDTVIIELHSQTDINELGLSEAELQQYGIVIDQYTRGNAVVRPGESNGDFQGIETIHGKNDLRDVVCYQSSHPTEYERSHAVAKLLLDDGERECTAWRVGPRENTMMTNEHCISNQEDLDAAEIWFNYQAITCGKEDIADVTKVLGNALLIDDKKLDFALFTVMDPETISSFGSIELNPRQAIRNEEIYIPAHPGGAPKKFGIESDMNVGNVCRVDDAVIDGVGKDTDIGYYCDSEGGSSGAPLLARASHTAIGLHHMSGPLNSSVRMDLIWPKVKPHLYKEELGYAWITHPADGDSLIIGTTYRIEVQTSPPAVGVKLQIFQIFEEKEMLIEELDMSAYNSRNLLWLLNWAVPEEEGEYLFIAEATFSESKITNSADANITVRPIEPVAVTFLNPTDEQNDLVIGETIQVEVEASDTKDFDVASVLLDISPSDFGAGGFMGESEPGSGKWVLKWKPQPPTGVTEQRYRLTAIAKNKDNIEMARAEINVIASGDNEEIFEITLPDVVYINQQMEIRIKAPNAQNVELYFDRYKVGLIRDGKDWVFYWKALEENKGGHQIRVVAKFPNGETKEETRTFTVKEAPKMTVTPINSYSFLGTVYGELEKLPLPFQKYIPLGVSSKEYMCGVVGYQAQGGDIGEVYYEFDPADTIAVFLRSFNNEYQLMVDFNTWNRYLLVVDYQWEDRPEKWTINVLCVKKEVASLNRYTNLDDDVITNTGIALGQKACSIAGFLAKNGDINENGTHDIIEMYLDRSKGSWQLIADFANHNEGKVYWFTKKDRRIKWDIDLLCLNQAIASLDGPVPGKPFFLKEYFDLGDNVGVDRAIDTGFAVDDYVCGVTGFAARQGDINEDRFTNSDNNLLAAYMYEQNGNWHIRADFRTHNEGEDWDINIICALKDGRNPVQWDVSHEETEDENCVGSGTKCQVLRFEGIRSFVQKYQDYKVLGGGYIVSPLDFRSKCGGSEYIEVYINKRESGTGRLLWSRYPPDQCLKSGDVLRIQANNVYDLRGVSLIGGEIRPFELRPLYGPPILESAYSKLYLDEWPVGSGQLLGPGMEVTFSPSFHPEASKYEIQISEDGGAAWQACSTCGYNLNGFIQHHGTLACGHGFYRCLERNKSYAYRMRALNAALSPVTDWSNIISATSMEWPAHLELTARPDPGPYSNGAVVTLNLDLEKTHGKDLAVKWDLIAYSSATYTILDNTCQSGGLQNKNAVTCKLQIYKTSDTDVVYSNRSWGMRLLEPVPSIKVLVTGTDTLGDGFSSWDEVFLNFKQEKSDPDPSTEVS